MNPGAGAGGSALGGGPACANASPSLYWRGGDVCSKFLGGFRLPGEAQKIDRFMLKFAERFLVNNPGVFANAGLCEKTWVGTHPPVLN